MKKPVLVLQMQRLGDLVLTFPLLARLHLVFPGHPIWVVGEERFFTELMPLSPDAVYFPFSASGALVRQKYHAVINLSHRLEALNIAGSAETESLYGPYMDREGNARLAGAWQLYRASLTHNNRHNLFHWSDLNGLELLTPYQLAATRWPAPRELRGVGSGHIGLFLGASEAEKRPEPEFWTQLAGSLLAAGHKPVLLGGEAEKETGRAVALALGAPALNLTGRFTIKELAEFISGLDVMVTPDTGPMHVAVWTGTPTLNLSMGPVNAWETGPFAPDHMILRAHLSCIGCWQCTRPSIMCKERFVPGRIAALIHASLKNGQRGTKSITLPGLELLLSRRDAHGFYNLAPLVPPPGGETRHMAVSRFWQCWFGGVLGLLPEESCRTAAETLATDFPELAPAMAGALSDLFRHLSLGVRGRGVPEGPSITASSFWTMFPPFFRPLSGYVHMYLQNGDFSRQAFAGALELAEKLAHALRGHE